MAGRSNTSKEIRGICMEEYITLNIGKHLSETAIKLLPSITSIGTIPTVFQQFVDIHRQAVGEFNDQITEQIQKALSTFNMAHVELGKQFNLEHEKKVLNDAGWTFPVNYMEFYADELIASVAKYEAGNTRSLYDLFNKYYNSQRLDDIVSGIQANDHFSRWHGIISDCLEAHKNRKYSLSIPTMLLVIEGVAGDFCKYHKKTFIQSTGKEIRRSSGGDKIKGAVELFSEMNGEPYWVEMFFSAIDEVIYSDTEKLVKQTDQVGPKDHGALYRKLNRHAILHGKTARYNTPSNSLRCFLLLEVLALVVQR